MQIYEHHITAIDPHHLLLDADEIIWIYLYYDIFRNNLIYIDQHWSVLEIDHGCPDLCTLWMDYLL